MTKNLSSTYLLLLFIFTSPINLSASKIPAYIKNFSTFISVNNTGIRIEKVGDITGPIIQTIQTDSSSEGKNSNTPPLSSTVELKFKSLAYRIVNKTLSADIFFHLLQKNENEPFVVSINVGLPKTKLDLESPQKYDFQSLFEDPSIKQTVRGLFNLSNSLNIDMIEPHKTHDPGVHILPGVSGGHYSVHLNLKTSLDTDEFTKFIIGIANHNFTPPPEANSPERERLRIFLLKHGNLDAIISARADRQAEHWGQMPWNSTTYFHKIIEKNPLLTKLFPSSDMQYKLADALLVGVLGRTPPSAEDVIIDFEDELVKTKQLETSQLKKLQIDSISLDGKNGPSQCFLLL